MRLVKARMIAAMARGWVGLALVSLLFMGCVREYMHPRDVALQAPASGQALVYFLRAPDDPASIELLGNDKRLATLPPESYVVLSLAPGSYRFSSVSSSLFSSGRPLVEPLELVLSAGQRVFFHVSGSTERFVGPGSSVFVPGTGLLPIGQRQAGMSGRFWQECSEIDARGLITISRQVFPE